MGLHDNLPWKDHKASFDIELDTGVNYGEIIESFSCKMDNLQLTFRSLSENHTMTLSDPKIVKRKDVSEGENIYQAPKDEGFNIPLSAMHREKSVVLEKKETLVNVGTKEAPKITFYVESLLGEEQKNLDNFAWSYIDVLGIDLEVVVHHLIVYLEAKPIKKKLRKMHPQIVLLVKFELQKLLDVGFIRPIDYPEWVSNLVPVSKPTGGIKICIDFRDLNKASSKDDFPLLNIDIIVDLVAGHEMLSLMDGFSGYNQIMITKEDQHKTAFTFPWGTY